MTSQNNPTRPERDGRWWFQPELAVLTLLVVGAYFTCLTALPVCGEEGRWARGAVQMIDTGDWIVPRQQNEVFAERPPMSSWCIALAGLVRGKVDDVAIRLPSVLAILLTTWMIYVYGCQFLTRLAAMVSGVVYATFGQVLQIGRMGESEAVFTLLVSASLLMWHLGYTRRWSPASVWSLGYSLAALAALVKGPQAPIYFVAVTWGFLALGQQWRWIWNIGHLMGMLAFALILGAWQVPYYLATDWPSVVAVWCGLATDRLAVKGFPWHLLTYPVESFVCLLPWSVLLLLLFSPTVRESMREHRAIVRFLVTSILVTYPTVWFAALGEGRYFMPLYPAVALLIGVITEQCVRSDAVFRARVFWNNLLVCYGLVCLAVGIWVFSDSILLPDSRSVLDQPTWFAAVFGGVAVVTAAVLFGAGRPDRLAQSRMAIVTLGGFLAFCYTGLVMKAHATRWNNPSPSIISVKSEISAPHRLVSFGPIDHRFAFFYETQIEQLPWPTKAGEVPDDVTYFCFNRCRGDTTIERRNGRGRTWTTTFGSLPFHWEEVSVVCCERKIKERPHRVVVIGRRLPGPVHLIGAEPTEFTQRR